jgi:integrase
MAGGGRRKIGLREVRALAPNSEVWDAAVTGFGARRQRSAAVAYVVMYRTKEGRLRRYTIGRHGAPWTPETARAEAQRLLGVVAQGGDPAGEKRAARAAVTVAELCDRYLADAAAGRLLTRRGRPKRPKTLEGDRGRVARHIKPLLGRLPVAAVTPADVERFMHDVAEGRTAATVRVSKYGTARVRGGRTAAARTLAFLGAVFERAAKDGLREDNPVRRVVRFADGKRERRLTDAEFAALGEALRRGEAAGIWPPALACARFLALTGWRKGEALTLRWSEVDLARRTARLPDTKTGASVRPLPNAACDLLRSLPRLGERVFPASRGAAPMAFTKHWCRIAKAAGLPADVTPHTLRHSFVSVGNDLDYSDSTVGALVGHRSGTMTGRYTHHADAVLLAAADAVADRIAELMGDAKPGGMVVAHPRAHRRAR